MVDTRLVALNAIGGALPGRPSVSRARRFYNASIMSVMSQVHHVADLKDLTDVIDLTDVN